MICNELKTFNRNLFQKGRGSINWLSWTCCFAMSILSAEVLASEEFNFDAQPVYTVEEIPNFANVCQQYVEKKLGLVVGQNFKPNGDDFWIQVGEGVINGPVGGKDYITARMNAYEKALLDAKRNTLQEMKVEVGREVAYKTLPAEQKQELQQSASPEDQKKIAQYEDTRDLQSAWNKSLELLNRELDDELKATGPAKGEPAPKTLEEAAEKQLRLFGERFSDTINIGARSRLSGIRRMFVFDSSPKGTEKGKICVAVVSSDKTRSVADAMFTQDASLLPPAQPGVPLAAQIPSSDTNEGRNALVNTMGVDMRVDENGNYWLISYAHAAPPIANNTKARQIAADSAYARALGGLRTFMAEQAVTNTIAQFDESSDQFEGGSDDQFFSKYESFIESKSESMNISGAVRGGTFGLKHPTTGNELIGTYVKWSAASMEGAKKKYKKMNTVPKPSASNSGSGGTSGNSGSSATAQVSQASVASNSNLTRGCEIEGSHRFKTVTVKSYGTGATVKDATLSALESGVGQVNGLAIAAQTTNAVQSVSVSNGDESESAFSEKFQQSVSTATKGVIRCWQLLSQQFNQSTGLEEVNIQVTVTKYNADPSINLPRFAVTDFRVSPSITLSRQVRKTAASVPSRIMDVLSKSQKFALIDRQYMKLTNAELNLISGQDFKLEELARLGNRVGTDYLIVGTVIAASEAVKTRKMASTGKVFRSKDSEVRVSVRVIDVATSQIVFADEPAFGGEYPIATVIDYVSQLAGVGIVNTIHQNLMPIPSPPQNKKTTLKQVKDFSKNGLDSLKQESKNDW